MKKSYGKESDLNLRLWVISNRFNINIHRELLTVFKKHGLSAAQFAVLEVLYHKGDLTVGEIIDKILITGGNITVVIKNLEQKDLLSIKQDQEDGRKRLICINQKGRRLLEKAFKDHLNVLNNLLSVYSHEEKEQLIKILRKTHG